MVFVTRVITQKFLWFELVRRDHPVQRAAGPVRLWGPSLSPDPRGPSYLRVPGESWAVDHGGCGQDQGHIGWVLAVDWRQVPAPGV